MSLLLLSPAVVLPQNTSGDENVVVSFEKLAVGNYLFTCLYSRSS